MGRPVNELNNEQILLLSIRPIHGKRIFSGEKQYELRKMLPRRSFKRVYLYESGGRGVTGCFDVAGRMQKPVALLWDEIGAQSSPRASFQAYFQGWENGWAIKIANTVEFETPLVTTELRKLVPTFSAPQSFLLLERHDRLFTVLEQKRRQELPLPEVQLRRIAKQHYGMFKRIVTSEIAPKYDEITPDFAESILRSHELGEDPYGILTQSKEVLSIWSDHDDPIGFTTLTYKIGGSVKTGPTILLPQHRRKGLGTATRHAIEAYVRKLEKRKLYCTCPDSDQLVIDYLLRSGMRIEVHLTRHYRKDSGEIVFGKLLTQRQSSSRFRVHRARSAAQLISPSQVARTELVLALQRMFSELWEPITKSRALRIIKGALLSSVREYEDKPISLICASSRGRCRALVLLVPKRGGATKGLLLSATNHGGTLRSLIEEAERVSRQADRRKLYFLHPLSDHELVEFLRRAGYACEGVLQEPYSPGQDVAVLSKFLTTT